MSYIYRDSSTTIQKHPNFVFLPRRGLGPVSLCIRYYLGTLQPQEDKHGHNGEQGRDSVRDDELNKYILDFK